MRYDAIVVGAGISGLLSALCLSKEGKSVLVLEKSDFVGGNARSYNVDGYTVDTGPHAITCIPNGPLARLLNKYNGGMPKLVPHGHYYFRTGKGLHPVPSAIKDWAGFKAISNMDKIVFSRLILAEMIRESVSIDNSERSVYDAVKDYNVSDNAFRMIDTLCHFMSGKSMKKTPAKRMFSGFGLEGMKKMNIVDTLYGLKRFFISHSNSKNQWYPIGGLGAIVNSITDAFSEDLVTVKTGTSVDKIIIKNGKAVGVESEGEVYNSDIVVYSGFIKDLDKVVTEKLPEHFSKDLKKIKQAKSYTLWLGINGKIPGMDYKGSEIWYETGEPFWAMPTSNLDASLAPAGHQLITFSFIVKDSVEKTRKEGWDTILSVYPGIDKKIVMKHEQVTIPEKAAITTDSFFPGPVSPFSGLYLVGTDVDKRSMGMTRAAHSVEDMLVAMKKEGLFKN